MGTLDIQGWAPPGFTGLAPRARLNSIQVNLIGSPVHLSMNPTLPLLVLQSKTSFFNHIKIKGVINYEEAN